MNISRKQLLLVFLTGLFLGGALGLGGARYCSFHSHHKDPFDQKFHELGSRLSLTSAQKEQVSAILEINRVKMDKLRSEIRPKFETIRNGANNEIRKLLDPEQQKKFDTLQAEWETRMRKFEEKEHSQKKQQN